MGHHMDKYLILSTTSRADCEAVLSAINALAAQWWQAQGYTVIDGQLVGKNAATGEDMPDAAKTVTWDEVREAPDGTFYISSLSNDERFANGMNQLPADVLALFEEVEMPIDWVNHMTDAQLESMST